MIEKLVEQLLAELGEDVHREGLVKTPERVASSPCPGITTVSSLIIAMMPAREVSKCSTLPPDDVSTNGKPERCMNRSPVWTTFAIGAGAVPVASYDAMLAASGLDVAGAGVDAGAPMSSESSSCGPALTAEPLSSALVADPETLAIECVSEGLR